MGRLLWWVLVLIHISKTSRDAFSFIVRTGSVATCLISVRDVIKDDLDINLVGMTPITSTGNHSDLEHMCGLNRFIYSYVVMPKIRILPHFILIR